MIYTYYWISLQMCIDYYYFYFYQEKEIENDEGIIRQNRTKTSQIMVYHILKSSA